MQATLGRLSQASFELVPLPDITTHYVVTRDELVAFIYRQEDGEFGSSGNPGKLSERGLATFLRRGDGGVFVAKGLELEASAEECALAVKFAADLRQALAEPGPEAPEPTL
jgi:hypothetical protein